MYIRYFSSRFVRRHCVNITDNSLYPVRVLAKLIIPIMNLRASECVLYQSLEFNTLSTTEINNYNSPKIYNIFEKI